MKSYKVTITFPGATPVTISINLSAASLSEALQMAAGLAPRFPDALTSVSINVAEQV